MALKKGQKINPLGPLPIGNDLKEARKITRIEFEKIVNKYLFMNFEKIKELMEDEDARSRTPILDMIIISILHKALVEGDERRFNFILDRTIGQAVKRLHVVTEVGDHEKTSPIPLTAGEKLEMLEKYKTILQNQKEVEDVSVADREDKPSV